jgi:hypothetical protein
LFTNPTVGACALFHKRFIGSSSSATQALLKPAQKEPFRSMVAVHCNLESGAHLKPFVGRKGGYEIDQGEATKLLQQHGVTPTPTSEDQIVLYLGSIKSVQTAADRIREVGHQPEISPNPYWQRDGAVGSLIPTVTG